MDVAKERNQQSRCCVILMIRSPDQLIQNFAIMSRIPWSAFTKSLGSKGPPYKTYALEC
jgi:hypothetical protein